MDPVPAAPARPLIVGIGASAGGFEAIRSFLRRMPADTGCALVIVQHLDPASRTLLSDLLAKLSPMPVVPLRGPVRVEADRVYVAEPSTVVSLEQDTLVPLAAASEKQRRMCIDEFFRSLAAAQGQNAVGIVLSGAGSDGTLGLRSIREAGGMTISQDPATAKFETMPQNAAASAGVDHVLPPVRMPAEIVAYARHLGVVLGPSSESIQAGIEQAIHRICEVLQQETGQNFKHYKRNTLVRRIQRRLQVLHLSDAETYLRVLDESRPERQALFKELLIGVTSFFRDPEAFAALAENAIPQILAQREADEPIRVWVPGCATGEEAFTIAMLFLERLDQLGPSVARPHIQIFATDIDERAVAAARAGIYPQGIASDVSAERLQRFFVKHPSGYRVSKAVRDLCLFSMHNLISDPPFSRLDLISCRNLLIYLGTHLQKKLIPVFHYALRPNGFLLLGPSENLAKQSELFRPVSSRHRLSQRRPSSIPGRVEFPASERERTMRATRGLPEPPQDPDLGLIAQRIVLDEFAPAYALVHEDGEIVYLSEKVSRFLEPPAGKFDPNLMRMAKPGLKVGLRAVFSDAVKSRRKSVHDEVSLPVEGGLQRVMITVQPMPRLGEDSGLFMIVFQEAGLPVTREAAGETRVPEATGLIEQLERELATTRSDLDSTVQDLEAANEELKSSNEELLSMNEELQSANEELETSKEDLQAANESLARSNSDLSNLLQSTQIATVFLDESYRIRDFTPAVASIQNLIRSDIGRPLDHTTHRFRDWIPLPAFEQVLHAAGPISDELESVDGSWYLRRVSPYRSSQGEVDGVVMTFLDVTPLKRIEVELRESEKRFRRMADSAPILIWESDVEKRYTWFNRVWLDFTGRTLDQERGFGWTESVHPDDLERCVEVHSRSSDRREPFEVEFRLRRHDGAWRWILGHGVPRFDERGGFLGFIGSCKDITDRKNALEVLRESEQRFRLLADSSPLLIWVNDVEEGCQFVNQAYLDFVGRPLEALVGSRWLESVHPEDREAYLAVGEDALAARVSFEAEVRMLRADGAWRTMHSVGIPRFAQNGKLLGHAGCSLDVTERVEARELLATSEARLRELADAMPQIVWIADPDGQPEYVNRRWVERIGAGIEEIRDGGGSVLHAEDRERTQLAWKSVLASGEPYEIEHRYRIQPDGEHRWHLTRALPIRGDDGRIARWLGTSTDIDDQKRLEVEREHLLEAERAARAEVDRVARLKDEFLATLSHELRTPLNAILGWSQLLRSGGVEGASSAQGLEVIERNARTQARLIADLLDVSRIVSGRLRLDLQPVDFAEVIAAAVDALVPEASAKGVGLEVALAEEGCRVRGDPSRLEQVTWNLVSNALKFTPRGGSVRVALEITGERAVLTIEDDGKGISSEFLPHLFERFSQGDPSITRRHGGLGLGLSIVKQLVELHGGTVRAESDGEGRGATFVVELPQSGPPAAPGGPGEGDEPSEEALQYELAGLRVLVVDDEVDARELARRIVESRGAEVATAGSAEEALGLLESFRPEVVVSDIGMPGEDGYRLLARMRAQAQGPLPAIALTAFVRPEDRATARRAGFEEHVAKPVEPARLLAAIARVANR